MIFIEWEGFATAGFECDESRPLVLTLETTVGLVLLALWEGIEDFGNPFPLFKL
jgi:hypothetical protein